MKSLFTVVKNDYLAFLVTYCHCVLFTEKPRKIQLCYINITSYFTT